MGVREEAFNWAKDLQKSGQKVTKAMLNAKIVELQEVYTPEKNVEKAIAYAEQSGDLTGAENLRAMQRGPEQFAAHSRKTGVAQLPLADRYNFMGKPMGETGAKILEASFPRTAQAMASGNDFSPFSAIGDIASAPGRVLESGVQAAMGNGDFLNRMSQIDVPEIGSSIMRDPTTPFMGMGAGLYGTLSKGASPVMKAGGLGAAGATTQAPVSMYSGMERESRGGEFGGGELGAELAISGVMGPAGPVVSKGLTKVGDVAKKTLSTLSGKSQELLETIGAKEVKQTTKEIFQRKENVKPDKTLESIKNYGDKAEEIVGDVVNYMDNFEDLYRKENHIIGDAVKEMGDIDLRPVVADLNDMKLRQLHPDLQKQFKEINGMPIDIPYGYRTGRKSTDDYLEYVDNVIDDITGQSVKTVDASGKSIPGVKTETRPAGEALKIRRMIDETTNFSKNNVSHGYASSLDAVSKKARTGIKNQLEQAAINTGNPEYVKSMSDFHKLLNTRDRVNKQILGKQGSQDKVKNFLLTLGNPDKLDNKILARDLEKILGKDLMEESRLLRLAKEYKNGLSVFTDLQTGKSNYLQSGLEGAQKAAAMAVGSPMVGAPLTAGISAGQEAIRGGGAGRLSRQYASPGIQLLTGGNNE